MTDTRLKQQKCWRFLARRISQVERGVRFRLNSVVLECISEFPVTEACVRNHIKVFYVDEDVVSIEDGFLVPARKVERTSIDELNDKLATEAAR